jgi:2-dehydropantoate 2-reductase
MNKQQSGPRIAVVGAGAVGCYFGGMLADAGAPVVLIGRPAFVDAVNRDGLLLDTLQTQKRVRVETSTEMIAARNADFVLFCVKTTDNAATARQLSPVLDRNATVLCLQNGVDNVEQLRAAAGIEALAAVVYVAASMPAPGHLKHVGRGDLVLGPPSAKVSWISDTFTRANVPCRITDNIAGELWIKLLSNCALNAVSALGQARYRQLAEGSDARQVMQNVVNEVWAVAHAAQITLPGLAGENAAVALVVKIAEQMAGALSSTAQDINRGKKTEIDSLNGYISRRGAELGVPTPVNHALYTLIKLLENRAGS